MTEVDQLYGGGDALLLTYAVRSLFKVLMNSLAALPRYGD